eukprot:m.259989 g.259989  ORF g.259989 m.259989 type:complete len:98 (-) comp54590_c0_seq2:92-385(-)
MRPTNDLAERDFPAVPTKPLAEWTEADVAIWLASMDLSKFSAAFGEQGLAGPSLLSLDSAALDAMSITLPLHRTMLLHSVGQLRMRETATAEVGGPI